MIGVPEEGERHIKKEATGWGLCAHLDERKRPAATKKQLVTLATVFVSNTVTTQD